MYTVMKNYKFNLTPSNIDPKDIVLEAYFKTQPELPEEYNVIDKLMPIRDQGEQGSCSAMTAATIKEYQERKDFGFNSYMSPQFIYNLRENKGSEGMTPRDTMNILYKFGVVPEEKYPYMSKRGITNDLFRVAANLRIKNFGRIHTIYLAKVSILLNGPLYLGLPVYHPKNEQFWTKLSPQDEFLGGHAVCFVGWDKDGFIGRNSWGPKWGNKGYFHFPYSDWGVQWEAWTTIDDTTNIESLKRAVDNYRKTKVGCCTKIGKWFKKLLFRR